MSNTFKVWHGSRRWEGTPELRSAKAGRAEWGAGIYGTTHFETAMKYAKGGGKVRLLTIKGSNCLEQSAIPLPTAIDFVKRYLPKRTGSEIINILIENAERTADRIRQNRTCLPAGSQEVDWVGAEVLRNLCVNFDLASGARGVEVSRFFASMGIGYSMDRGGSQSDEYWVVVFDPSLILESKGYTYEEASVPGHELPSPQDQLSAAKVKPKAKKEHAPVMEP